MRLDNLLDEDRFLLAMDMAVNNKTEKGSIGTFGEKLLHRTLKYYFEPNSSFHEIPLLGLVADISNENGVIEIQTRSFEKLVPKLQRFLPQRRVTIVYPLIEKKTICYIDTKSGESLSERKSSKRGRPSDALPEIAKIRQFIPNENLKILLVFVDITETRMLSGKKKIGRQKTAKIDCIPTSINSIFELRHAEDFAFLLSEKLPSEFTSSEFERVSRLHAIQLHNSLMLLVQLGIFTREKRGGNAYTYSISKKPSFDFKGPELLSK